ncbi:MAG: hypothetical protein C4547_08285 [Phycisphaerales bacterium]|nr:MAG: hypothetical protein C4547_08285 [Phycisphaerales bacterium]
MTPQPNIVVADALDDAALARLRAAARVVEVDGRDMDDLREALTSADGLVVRTYTRVTEALLAHAPRLRVIGRAGVGVDNIDLAAARSRRIAVVHTPAAATDAVADLTVGLMIAVLRCTCRADALVRQGRFDEARELPIGVELAALTLGIVGMGRIGKAVARRCYHGFAMPVLYTDIIEPGPLPCPATRVSLEENLQRADVLTLHVPLTDQTRGMIAEEAFAHLALREQRRLQTGAVLINTARGPVVNTEALVRALKPGRLSGAGLDVTDPEPLPDGHPLLADPRVVITPHAGARTWAAHARMCAVVEDVLGVLRGEPPRFPVEEDEKLVECQTRD